MSDQNSQAPDATFEKLGKDVNRKAPPKPSYLPKFDLSNIGLDADDISNEDAYGQTSAILTLKSTIGQCDSSDVKSVLKTLSNRMAKSGDQGMQRAYINILDEAGGYAVTYYPATLNALLNDVNRQIDQIMPRLALSGDKNDIQDHEEENVEGIRALIHKLMQSEKDSEGTSLLGQFVRRRSIAELSSPMSLSLTVHQMISEAELSINSDLQREILNACAQLLLTINGYARAMFNEDAGEERLEELLYGQLSALKTEVQLISESITKVRADLRKLKQEGRKRLLQLMRTAPVTKSNKVEVLETFSGLEAPAVGISAEQLDLLESQLTRNFGFAQGRKAAFGIPSMINTESLEMQSLLNGLSKTYVSQVYNKNHNEQVQAKQLYFNAEDVLAYNVSIGNDMNSSELLDEIRSINLLVRANLHPISWSKYFGKTMSAMSKRFIEKWVAGDYEQLTKQDILDIVLVEKPRDRKSVV